MDLGTRNCSGASCKLPKNGYCQWNLIVKIWESIFFRATGKLPFCVLCCWWIGPFKKAGWVLIECPPLLNIVIDCKLCAYVPVCLFSQPFSTLFFILYSPDTRGNTQSPTSTKGPKVHTKSPVWVEWSHTLSRLWPQDKLPLCLTCLVWPAFWLTLSPISFFLCVTRDHSNQYRTQVHTIQLLETRGKTHSHTLSKHFTQLRLGFVAMSSFWSGQEIHQASFLSKLHSVFEFSCHIIQLSITPWNLIFGYTMSGQHFKVE